MKHIREYKKEEYHAVRDKMIEDLVKVDMDADFSTMMESLERFLELHYDGLDDDTLQNAYDCVFLDDER